MAAILKFKSEDKLFRFILWPRLFLFMELSNQLTWYVKKLNLFNYFCKNYTAGKNSCRLQVNIP